MTTPESGPSVLEVMSEECHVVGESESVLDAAELMVTKGLGFIPVVDEQRRFKTLVGSDDILVALVAEKDLTRIPSGQLEGRDVAIDRNATVQEAAAMIAEAGVTPLPVLGEDSVVVGAIGNWEISAHVRMEAQLGSAVSNVITTISPQDWGYMGQRGPYYVAASSALECIRRAMWTAGKKKRDVTSVLDLGCGYGRVLRVLRAAFADASIAACDLDRGAVDFCAETFGATPIYSDPDSRKVEIPRDFDLIWSGSLFTHLDKNGWLGFFELSIRHLAEGGILVFTTHGRHDRKTWGYPFTLDRQQIDELLRGYDEEGFGYAGYAPNGNIGITANSPDWVRARIDERPDLRFLMHTAKGWDPPYPPQDVFACTKKEG